MTNAELLDAGSGSQDAGLTGSEMVFFRGNILVLFQKGSFDKEMIGVFCQGNDLFRICRVVGRIDDVRNFLSRGDQGNPLCQFAQHKMLRLTVAVFDFKFRFGIPCAIECVLKFG